MTPGYKSNTRRRSKEDKEATAARRARLREDSVAFAREVLSFEPHKAQIEALRYDGPTLCLPWGRGAGKTLVAAADCLHHMITQPHSAVVWVSARDQTSDYARSVMKNFIAQSDMGLESMIAVDSSDMLKLNNGSLCKWEPNSEVAVRSVHALWKRGEEVDHLKRRSVRLYIDESALVDERVFNACNGILSAGSQGQAWYFGTAAGENCWYYRQVLLGLEGTHGVHTIQVSSLDLEHTNKEHIERFRETTDEATFAAEYEGRFQRSLSSYFSKEMIAAATRQYGGGPILTGDEGRHWTFSLGCDLAISAEVGSAHNAFVIVGRYDPDPFNLAARPKDHNPQHDIPGPSMVVYTGDTIAERTANRDKILSRVPHKPTPEDEYAEYTVCHIIRELTVDSYRLKEIISELLHLYPGLTSGRTETYESLVWSEVVQRVRHVSEFGDERTPRGHGRLNMTMQIFHPTNQTKNDAYGLLHRTMRESRLAIPGVGAVGKQLREEMLHLRKTISPTGLVKIAADPKFKRDDVADGCSFALHEIFAGRHAPPGKMAAGRRT